MIDINIVLAFIFGLIAGIGIMMMRNVYQKFWHKKKITDDEYID